MWSHPSFLKIPFLQFGQIRKSPTVFVALRLARVAASLNRLVVVRLRREGTCDAVRSALEVVSTPALIALPAVEQAARRARSKEDERLRRAVLSVAPAPAAWLASAGVAPTKLPVGRWKG